MTSEQWDRVERRFEEALARPAEERAAFLEDSCNDPVVRREVASLLGMADEAEDLFDRLTPAVQEQRRQQKAGWEPGTPNDPLGLEDTEVGRYRVDAHLGGGGMGVVYRAHDTRLDRPVALKFLPPHLAAHPEAEERFAREAKAAAALDHPHIATIHEIGETEAGRRFIAMAYYEGETLKEKISREGPLPVEEALGYAEQIAEALARAHEAGIVHRDVKPANVMVTAGGDVKLLDFGLAQVAAETRLTDPEQQLGTAAYMSPEQAEGEEVGVQTDVWALGVVLYEMLTGERPFRGERETAVLHAILHEEPEPVGAHRPDLSPTLERIVERCLQKDLDRRYGSAAALLGDLRPLAKDPPSIDGPAAPVIGSAYSGGPAVRSRWLVGAGIAVLIALGAVLGWALWPVGPVGNASLESTSSPPSIAVLPFEALGKKEPGSFTKGIHEDVLTRLSSVSGLRVIARTSVQQYRNTNKPVRQIAQELGVKWVLEGSVQEAGDQIQLSVQLIDPKTSTYVWTDRYRRALTAENVFDLQGEVTQKIVQSLEAQLSPEEQRRIASAPTGNLEAYRLYIQGRTLLRRRTKTSIREGMTRFKEAIAEDSSYALAWSGLADAKNLLANRRYGGSGKADRILQEALAATHRALEIDPELAEAHASLGGYYLQRQEGPAAVRRLRRALELRPSYSRARHWLGLVLLPLGQLDSAVHHIERAVDLNPRMYGPRLLLSVGYSYQGRLEKALLASEKAAELGFVDGATEYTGRILSKMGRQTAAIDTLQRVLEELEPRPSLEAWTQAWLAVAQYQTGRSDQARQVQAQIEQHFDRPFIEAIVHAGMGEREAALRALRDSAADYTRWPQVAALRWSPVFDPLRGDPRFEEAIRRANRTWGLNPDGSLPEETGRTQTSTR
jgi:serine/threonine protein kinase/tetratricopeptide (TPR) repeat protein